MPPSERPLLLDARPSSLAHAYVAHHPERTLPVEDEACVPGQDEQGDCRLCRTDADPLLSSLCACGFQGTCGG